MSLVKFVKGDTTSLNSTYRRQGTGNIEFDSTTKKIYLDGVNYTGEVDSELTQSSNNPVSSSALYKVITENELTTAAALTEHEDRLDELRGAIDGKLDALTFDATPTANSTNPVTSGGVKTYVDNAIEATDNIFVIECSGDLNTDVRGTETQLTITNNITAADVIEAYENGKKIEIRHTYVHSGAFDNGCIITSTIGSVKTQTENNNTALIGTAINTGTPVLTVFGVDYRTYYLLNVQHNEQDDTNDKIGIVGFIMDHPIYIDGNNEGELILGWETLTGSPFAPKFRYYDHNTRGTGVVAYTTDLESITSMTEITYSDLVTARNNNNLKPGTWYRITDYTTTTTQADTQSAGHNFDVIVLATSSNTLSEEARAIKHDGDTYFANSNLSAWKIWYSLDDSKYWSIIGNVYNCDIVFGGNTMNDVKAQRVPSQDTEVGGVNYYYWNISSGTSFYLDSDTLSNGNYDVYYPAGNSLGTGTVTIHSVISGTGTIYRMIDEFNNDMPYDFKNIQFKRKLSNGGYDETNGTDTWCYTLNYWNSTDSICQDMSIVGNTSRLNVYGNKMGTFNSSLNDNVFLGKGDYFYCNSNRFGDNCHSNTFGERFISNTFGNDCDSNIFGDVCNNNIFGNYCRSNTFGNSCSNNIFGNDCYNNTFGNSYRNNIFGNYCYDNTLGNVCEYNILGNDCYSNTFGNSCSKNVFGNTCYSNSLVYNCYDNIFGNECYSNIFENHCSGNTFGNSCGYNTFGDSCNYNVFGNVCYSNAFENACYSNVFRNNCSNNKFGNNCHHNTFENDCEYNIFGTSSSAKINYVRYIRVENGVRHVNITTSATTSSSNYLQNLIIYQGIQGTSSSKKTITHPTVGDTFLTEYKPANSQVISI